MLNMIIADDEPIITKGIQMLLNWEMLGIRITGAYDDGLLTFKKILAEEPDIAILDISMPGKSGIDILQELRTANCKTQVIFISGFQDFEYAQAAVHYGAIDYLLKPVKKDSLVSAIGKCVGISDSMAQAYSGFRQQSDIPASAYRQLAHDEQTSYTVTSVKLLGLEKKSDMEKQLIMFSAFGKIEEIIETRKKGIVFQKEGKIYIVFSGLSRSEAHTLLFDIQKEVQRNFGCNVGFVLGQEVHELRQIAEGASKCDGMLRYFQFEDQLDSLILEVDNPIFLESYSNNELKALRNELLVELFRKDFEAFMNRSDQYLRAVCIISGGRMDTALYYLLTCIRVIEERLELMDILTSDSKITDIMEKVHDDTAYRDLAKIFKEVLTECHENLCNAMQTEAKKDIINAKQYIEEHYAENITLETMSKYIHMNSFYFSSFFKKHTGQNFKDYLNSVRMRHAMELLMTTQKKTYEIAEDVGFKDYRYFSELFSRYYGKTPAAYKKQM